MTQWISAEVMAVEDLSETYRLMSLNRPEHYSFQVGQYFEVQLNGPDQGSWCRPYSIASAPSDARELVLCVQVASENATSLAFRRFCAGDLIPISPAQGNAFNTLLEGPVLLVAGGSGIAPVRSIIRERLSQKIGPTYLVYGCRSQTAFPFYHEFEALGEKHPDFFPFFGLDAGAKGAIYPGNVLEALKVYVESRMDPAQLLSAQVFSCGSQYLVDAVSEYALSQGLSRGRIHGQGFG